MGKLSLAILLCHVLLCGQALGLKIEETKLNKNDQNPFQAPSWFDSMNAEIFNPSTSTTEKKVEFTTTAPKSDEGKLSFS